MITIPAKDVLALCIEQLELLEECRHFCTRFTGQFGGSMDERVLAALAEALKQERRALDDVERLKNALREYNAVAGPRVTCDVYTGPKGAVTGLLADLEVLHKASEVVQAVSWANYVIGWTKDAQMEQVLSRAKSLSRRLDGKEPD